MCVVVDYSEHFLTLMENLSDVEQELLGDLALYIELNGLADLPGRNKKSNDFPETFQGKKRIEAENFVKINSLWHYHVGYITYRKRNIRGDWTSEYVVHYQNLTEKNIRFVHYSSHYPYFCNPLPQYLN
ncbi:hypothetical protein [Atlantibacter subterraneus]|uniref:hypothetical protein n=1 Tax=Atlantibacter subterraneus TaxID=255519 RepID=UPI002FDC7ED9